jgi:hypothetical protein
MKSKLLLCLALGLSGGLVGCSTASHTNSIQWATFTDTTRHFHLQYPATWKINTETIPVMHYRLVFVSLNSVECFTVGNLQTSENTWQYGSAETIKQLPAGAAYMDIGWWEGPPGPRWGPDIHEMEAADLSALLKTNHEEKEDGLVVRQVEFHKWGRSWSIMVYIRPPVSRENHYAMEKVLNSFHFDGVPSGDPVWAIGEARKHLPHEADPNQFTNEGGSSVYYVSTTKDGDDVLVTFTKHLESESKKTWSFRVTAIGTVVPIASEDSSSVKIP